MLKKEYLIYKLSEAAREACKIDNELFPMYNVKRGLRNEDGSGVLVGLTQVGNVVGYERLPEGGLKAIPGKLFYRGYDVEDLARDFIKEKRFGFEEVAYLLLSGKLPDKEELSAFKELLNDNMPLEQKTKMNILDLEGQNIMNILARSVLEMYTFDANPDDTSRDNLMRQSIELISKFPTIIAYAYNIYRHSTQGRSLHIRHPHENLSIAENFLHMLKRDFTDLDARTLDLLLVLQAEHGGGNNSTFTTRVVTSSGSDTYSVIAAAMSSLKGKKHGGANLMVMNMMDDIKEHVKDYADEEEIAAYLDKLLNKQAFDKKGLIYGMGHAVYSISDPREKVFKGFVEQLATDKGRNEDMLLYNNIEKIAPRLIAEQRKIYKGVSPNIDFYSGFVYDMLDIPRELYTPLFALARIVGWSAHRLEELITTDKIIRPAYKSLVTKKEYIDREKR